MLVIAILQIATTSKYYTATSSYITEQSATSGPSISGGFAELFGLSQDGGGSSNSGSFSDPSFFPTILSSQTFLLNLLDESFYFGIYQEKMTLREFIIQNDDRTLIRKWVSPVLGLPGRFVQIFEKKVPAIKLDSVTVGNEDRIHGNNERKPVSPILNLRREDLTAMGLLRSRIEVSSAGNIINITTKMPDPLVCAQLNQLVSTRLLDFVVKNETEKERRDLGFLERRVATARSNFEQVQKALAIFRDQNQGVISATARTEEQGLQSEYNILFGIYQQLATDLEKKKVALEEKTPVFTVFEPVYVPMVAEGGASFRTVLIYVMLGLILAFMWVVIRIARALFQTNGEAR